MTLLCKDEYWGRARIIGFHTIAGVDEDKLITLIMEYARLFV